MHPQPRLVAIDMDGTLLTSFSTHLSQRNVKALLAAQAAGITVAIATGRRAAYTTPPLEGHGLRADTPLITSNGVVVCTLDGELIDRCYMESRVGRGLCQLLRPFGSLVFTFDRPGRGELVLEDIEQVHSQIAMWVEANRKSIEVVKPLENALLDGENPIQGMVAGSVYQMREAEKALNASEWRDECGCTRTEYPARGISVLDLLPPGISKASALRRLAVRLGIDRSEVMAIGDNWNDRDMLEWAGQAVVMANATEDLLALAKLNRWEQAPGNDDDGVAVILEQVLAKMRTTWA